jgi:GNAT superfamily N-acetyltransferase
MAADATGKGAGIDRRQLDLVERHFWADIWASVPGEVAAEHGVERRDFGPLQATIAADLPERGMLNLILGAAEPGAAAEGHLAAAVEWARSRGASPCVPVTPGLDGAEAAEAWLTGHDFGKAQGWMKFVRDPHPPRFNASETVEIVELDDGEQEPFGMIAATGFGLPAWASTFFTRLPESSDWHCYVARIGGTAQACAAMLIHEGIAEFGIGATLEPARGHGCQPALLHRRIRDAIEAGCQTLFVETGEHVPGRPSPSYRNILRAGFKEAYLRPNWRLPG